MIFVYAKDKKTWTELEKFGSKLLKIREDGVRIYTPPIVQKFNYDKYKGTYVSNRITF